MDDEAFLGYAEECPDAVMVTDRDGRIQFVNDAFVAMSGCARAELLGNTPRVLKSGRHEPDFYRALWAALLAGRDFRAVFCNRRKTGELYYEEKVIRPHGAGFVSFGRDVTERSREIEKLAHAATHDSLTDLPNRRLYLDRLGQALRHAARRREQFVVAILDIDRFRDTNNAYGHPAGDAVLCAVAQRTSACVRDSDTVARIGGDEFALILSGTGEDEGASVLAKIVKANAVPVRFEGRRLPVSVSVGACAYPREADSEIELYRRADERMYESKRAGGNRYVLEGVIA